MELNKTYRVLATNAWGDTIEWTEKFTGSENDGAYQYLHFETQACSSDKVLEIMEVN